MVKFNYLLFIIGISLLLSACNKDVEIKAQSKSPNEAALHDIAMFLQNNLKGN